jgi:TRAP transporter TAXI family solute receptor
VTLWARLRSGDFELLTGRELWWVSLAVVAALASALWLLFSTLEPPPPKTVRITTGSPTGAYFAYGQKYAEHFKKHGITLEVMTSRGSVENLARLVDPAAGVMVGLLQSGVGDAAAHPQLDGLASVAYEPIWVLHKPRTAAERLTSLLPLRGKRVAIGAEGSGTRAAALKLLKAGGADDSNTTLLPLGGSAAVQALNTGQVDAVFLVAAADAPVVLEALDAGLEPISLDTADAYVRLMPWLQRIVLPRGVVNLQRNLPRQDVVMVASTATLVVHRDLHPAIAYLLMDAASQVHRAPALTNAQHEFPNERSMGFEQSAESQRFFKTGRPFLQRYLPFWLANLLERLAVSLLPALAVGVPLVRLLPRWLAWRERSALLRLYHQAELLQAQGRLGEADITRLAVALDALPLSVGNYVDAHNMRSHLEAMRSRLPPPAVVAEAHAASVAVPAASAASSAASAATAATAATTA